MSSPEKLLMEPATPPLTLHLGSPNLPSSPLTFPSFSLLLTFTSPSFPHLCLLFLLSFPFPSSSLSSLSHIFLFLSSLTPLPPPLPPLLTFSLPKHPSSVLFSCQLPPFFPSFPLFSPPFTYH